MPKSAYGDGRPSAPPVPTPALFRPGASSVSQTPVLLRIRGRTLGVLHSLLVKQDRVDVTRGHLFGLLRNCRALLRGTFPDRRPHCSRYQSSNAECGFSACSCIAIAGPSDLRPNGNYPRRADRARVRVLPSVKHCRTVSWCSGVLGDRAVVLGGCSMRETLLDCAQWCFRRVTPKASDLQKRSGLELVTWRIILGGWVSSVSSFMLANSHSRFLRPAPTPVTQYSSARCSVPPPRCRVACARDPRRDSQPESRISWLLWS